MTDQELLELAAKAAGYETEAYRSDGGLVVRDAANPYGFNWNPLTDDGDALRLVVKLGIISCVINEVGFTGIYLPAEHIGGKYDIVEHHKTDPYAATRRAIVRAAAILGD